VSLVGIDALTGTLKHGSLETISASPETENTWQCQENVWLMTPSQGRTGLRAKFPASRENAGNFCRSRLFCCELGPANRLKSLWVLFNFPAPPSREFFRAVRLRAGNLNLKSREFILVLLLALAKWNAQP
jgi:hypothetical protein